MIRQLQPWHESLGRRQVKSPKSYFRDAGLLHALLGIESESQLLCHPKVGASWEGYAIEETLKLVKADKACFRATHQGAELDLLLIVKGRRFGVEVKRDDAPRITSSMRIAIEDLKLGHLSVIYPGDRGYRLDDRVSVLPLAELALGKALVVTPRARRPATR